MILLKTFYAFIIFFELIVVMYIFTTWLFRSRTLSKYLYKFLAPILEPLEKLTRHSIMYMPIVEMSPILFLIILVYVQQILIDLF